MPEPNQPIIVIRKKAGHGGHHGGAWKVAYADFVTAMMAFFMVMWLMNSNEKIQHAIAGYFQDPTGRGKQTGSTVAGHGESLTVTPDNMSELKQQLEQAMKKLPEFHAMKDQVSMTVTGEGLRIELLETEAGMFFQSGSPRPSFTGQQLLGTLAAELGQLPNKLLIEGHTDSKPFSNGGAYSNWELSADRANEARKLMEASGLQTGQVAQVRGFADRRLRNADNSADPSNRRVSVIVQYLDAPAESAREEKTPSKSSSGHH
jgi:chemotaxis protein MotB